MWVNGTSVTAPGARRVKGLDRPPEIAAGPCRGQLLTSHREPGLVRNPRASVPCQNITGRFVAHKVI